MSEYPVKGMTAYHRQTLTNRMLGRHRPVTEANLGPVGNFYTVPLPTQNTVTVPLRRSSNTRKKSTSPRKSPKSPKSPQKRSSSRRKTSSNHLNHLKSSNNPSTLRDLERERKAELCKLLKEMDAPTFHEHNSRTWVILRAIRYLTQAIETKYPTKIVTKPHLYYKQISDYIIDTVFYQEKGLDVTYLKDLAKDLGLYKKCRSLHI
jgi:hypothetical protein